MNSASGTPISTIDPREAAHFGKMAADWWDPKGSSAMLHRLNPPRLRYIREAIDLHWDGDDLSFAPLAGRTALDVGCGAGLLAEPLARLGAEGHRAPLHRPSWRPWRYTGARYRAAKGSWTASTQAQRWPQVGFGRASTGGRKCPTTAVTKSGACPASRAVRTNHRHSPWMPSDGGGEPALQEGAP